MLKEEWLKRYYPVPAEDCTEEDAVAHSLRKWEGIVAWVKQHGTEKPPIRSDGSSCALCKFYAEGEPEEDNCTMCPLALHLGTRCDDNNAPWSIWHCTGNPQPMLDALIAIKSKE
jgi:hypothetical protein